MIRYCGLIWQIECDNNEGHIWGNFHCGQEREVVWVGDLTILHKEYVSFFEVQTTGRRVYNLGRKIWFQDLKRSSDSSKLYFDEVNVEEWETYEFHFFKAP